MEDFSYSSTRRGILYRKPYGRQVSHTNSVVDSAVSPARIKELGQSG